MKMFKDYKGVAMLCLFITLINVFWVIGYERPNEVKHASKDKQIVMNS